MKAARKFLAGFVVLALSIAIPASISAAWFVYGLWIAIGLAVVVLIALSEPLQRQIPWTIASKQEQKALVSFAGAYVLRRDLQTALKWTFDVKNPSVVELRGFADNLAQRLRDAGYAEKAKRVEVHFAGQRAPG